MHTTSQVVSVSFLAFTLMLHPTLKSLFLIACIAFCKSDHCKSLTLLMLLKLIPAQEMSLTFARLNLQLIRLISCAKTAPAQEERGDGDSEMMMVFFSISLLFCSFPTFTSLGLSSLHCASLVGLIALLRFIPEAT